MKSLLKHFKGDGLRAQLLKGAGGSAGLQGINFLLALFSSVLLARNLGPENYGIYAFVLSAITVLSLPSKAGLPTLLIRETAKNQLHEEWGLMRGLLMLSSKWALGYSILAIGLATIAVLWFSGAELDYQDQAFLWALWLLPLIGLEAVRSGTLRGLRCVARAQVPELFIRPMAIIVLVGGTLLLGAELTSLMAIQFNLVGAFAAFLLGTYFLSRTFPESAAKAKPIYTVKPWLASFFPLSLFVGLRMLDSQMSILLLGLLGTNEEVGLFRVAATGATLVAFGLVAVNIAMAPHIARLYSAGEMKSLQSIILMSTRAVAALSFLVAFVFFVWGEEIIALVFGEEYKAAWMALVVLCLGQLINVCAGPVGQVLNMTGNDKSTIIGASLALVANLILAVMLIPLFGLTGAAVGYSISMAILNLVLLVMVKKKVGINMFLFAR